MLKQEEEQEDQNHECIHTFRQSKRLDEDQPTHILYQQI